MRAQTTPCDAGRWHTTADVSSTSPAVSIFLTLMCGRKWGMGFSQPRLLASGRRGGDFAEICTARVGSFKGFGHFTCSATHCCCRMWHASLAMREERLEPPPVSLQEPAAKNLYIDIADSMSDTCGMLPAGYSLLQKPMDESFRMVRGTCPNTCLYTCLYTQQLACAAVCRKDCRTTARWLSKAPDSF